MKFKLLALLTAFVVNLLAQPLTCEIQIDATAGKHTISRHIYGHFAEHLGRCIYGGVWVGENSPIPNIRGFRKDVLEALKDLAVPNIRWPGGCFADEYHWMNGIGPREKRPKTVNTLWGGVIEDNSFGTHEFLEFCEMLGAEPYITVNVGSGTVKEAADWVEYVNSDEPTPMANLRRANGREKPWNVKYWGIGNESWGCGGIMTPEYYASEFARFSFFMKNYGGINLCKVASGGLPEDYHWTEVIMRKWKESDEWLKGYMGGYSLHFYTVPDWGNKGSATNFGEKEWYAVLTKTMEMEKLIKKHSEVMDKYDPEKRIGLFVDEWGTWYDVEPGTNPAFLYQQNTLRDALVAGVNLNIFNNYCDRVKMANIAQMVNVLQAVILTKDNQMVKTPTYYVFKMYKVHHDATLLPVVQSKQAPEGEKQLPLSYSASRGQKGLIHLTLCNPNLGASAEVNIVIKGVKGLEKRRGEIITAEKMNAYNDFGKPEEVNIKPFADFRVDQNTVKVKLPAKAVVMVEVAEK